MAAPKNRATEPPALTPEELALGDGGPALDLEAENAVLKAQNENLNARLARLEQLLAGTADPSPAELRAAGVEGAAEPVFDEDAPHGVVWGDPQVKLNEDGEAVGHDADIPPVRYVQNGHQFGPDKRYLGTEKHSGTPRPFNPRLVGFVRRPKPIQLPE